MKGAVCDKPAAQMLKPLFSSPFSLGLSLLRLSQFTVHPVGSTKQTSFPFYAEPQIPGYEEELLACTTGKSHCWVYSTATERPDTDNHEIINQWLIMV